jgi:hypothetical protein
MLHHVDWKTFTDVSGVLAASIIRTMMMEVADTSEMSVNFYHTTQRNMPKHSQLNTRRSENLKSRNTYVISF